jgi:hypothetical protein
LTAYSETTPTAVTTAIESLFCNIDTRYKTRDEYDNAIEEPDVDVKKLVMSLQKIVVSSITCSSSDKLTKFMSCESDLTTT